MGTIVDVTIPPGPFALTETFDVVPDATFEPVRVAAHGSEGAMELLWASSSDLSRLDGALRDDETTSAVARLSMDGEHALYRINWSTGTRAATETFVGANGTLLDAHGSADRWDFRVLFPNQAAVSTAYDDWRDRDLDPSIRHVNGLSDAVRYGGMSLSQRQHEALTAAFRTGYYDIPRGVTLVDLATDFDVSHQALSERLRRGHRTLVDAALCRSPASVRHQR